MACAVGALLICVYAVVLLLRFAPVYLPVECSGMDQPFHLGQTLDAEGEAILEEPIMHCVNRNLYDVQLSHARSGQVLALPDRVPIGWVSVQPLVLPARGEGQLWATISMRTGGRSGGFEVQMELTTRGYADMGLFMTVVTASFEQATTCSFAAKAEAGSMKRGRPICAASAQELPGKPPGVEGAAPAPAFELNLDREAFRKAERVLQAIGGLLIGISVVLGCTACFAGSWLLVWRRRLLAPERPGALAAPKAAAARGKAVAATASGCCAPDSADPPPARERPQGPHLLGHRAACGPVGAVPFDEEKGLEVVDSSDRPSKKTMSL